METIEQQYWSSDEAEKLAAIARLSERDREILMLHIVDQHSTAEIGDLFGMDRRSVANHIKMLIVNLRGACGTPLRKRRPLPKRQTTVRAPSKIECRIQQWLAENGPAFPGQVAVGLGVGRNTVGASLLRASKRDDSSVKHLETGPYAALSNGNLDPWKESIESWVTTQASVSVSEVLEHLSATLQVGRAGLSRPWGEADKTRVTHYLMALGWETYRIHRSRHNEWRFQPPMLAFAAT